MVQQKILHISESMSSSKNSWEAGRAKIINPTSYMRDFKPRPPD